MLFSSTKAKMWVKNVTKCLMTKQLGIINKPGVRCAEIASVIFDAFIGCLKGGSVGICNMDSSNLNVLCNVHDTMKNIDTSSRYRQYLEKTILMVISY